MNELEKKTAELEKLNKEISEINNATNSAMDKQILAKQEELKNLKDKNVEKIEKKDYNEIGAVIAKSISDALTIKLNKEDDEEETSLL